MCPVIVCFSPAKATMSPALADLISSRLFACIKSILPILSSLSLDEFRTEVPALSVPEYILIKVNDPTKGSLATLNAKAENFSLASNFIVIFSSVPILVPSIDFRSLGLGK